MFLYVVITLFPLSMTDTPKDVKKTSHVSLYFLTLTWVKPVKRMPLSSSPAPLEGHRGVHKPVERCDLSSMSSVCPVVMS